MSKSSIVGSRYFPQGTKLVAFLKKTKMNPMDVYESIENEWKKRKRALNLRPQTVYRWFYGTLKMDTEYALFLVERHGLDFSFEDALPLIDRFGNEKKDPDARCARMRELF